MSFLFAEFITWAPDQLLNFVWWAWFILSIIVANLILLLLLISRQPSTRRVNAFVVPLTPWLPGISILINTYLMLQLKGMTWIRFIVWITLGLIIYFFYGIRNSRVRAELRRGEQENHIKLLKHDNQMKLLNVN